MRYIIHKCFRINIIFKIQIICCVRKKCMILVVFLAFGCLHVNGERRGKECHSNAGFALFYIVHQSRWCFISMQHAQPFTRNWLRKEQREAQIYINTCACTYIYISTYAHKIHLSLSEGLYVRTDRPPLEKTPWDFLGPDRGDVSVEILSVQTCPIIF